MTAETAELPDDLPGHWSTREGREMAEETASQPRERLCMGHVSDLALANAVFMASRESLDLIAYQTAAKERIRWLSGQLALRNAELTRLTAWRWTDSPLSLSSAIASNAIAAIRGDDPCDEYVIEGLEAIKENLQHIANALSTERQAREEAERDAERFRALMRCGRIKMQGSSGVDPHTGERNGNNVHFGAEFWPEPPRPDVAHLDGGAQSTIWGRACLRALADAILEHEASHG